MRLKGYVSESAVETFGKGLMEVANRIFIWYKNVTYLEIDFTASNALNKYTLCKIVYFGRMTLALCLFLL